MQWKGQLVLVGQHCSQNPTFARWKLLIVDLMTYKEMSLIKWSPDIGTPI